MTRALPRLLRPGLPARLATACACLLLGRSVHAEWRKVAVRGETAPGTSTAFEGFAAPTINHNGEVAFGATVGPVNDDFLNGIFSEGFELGTLRKVMLEGDPAPGTGGFNFRQPESTEKYLFLNNLGDTVFVARSSAPGSPTGVWSDRERPTNDLVKVAYTDDLAPGAVGPRNFQSSFELRGFGDSFSGAAFMSILTLPPPPNNQFPSSGVFSEGTAVVLGKVAQTVHDLAPGTVRPSAGGGLAQFTAVAAPWMNDDGHVAFQGETNAGVSVGALGAGGVWTNSSAGTLRKVALAGESAPGTSTTFSQLFRDGAVINDNGDVAFMATLTGLINGNLREGAWVERAGVVQKVAFESEAAPGSASTFNDMRDTLLDGQGRAVFSATLADNRDGLWRESSFGTLVKVALQGDPAPGTALNYLNIQDLAVNDAGQVAFQSQLSNFSTAIFATDGAGDVYKVIAEGDLAPVDGDTMQLNQVAFLGMNGSIGGGGLSSGFNDERQVALFAAFNPTELHPDGLSGIFVVDPPAADSADFDGDNDVDGVDFLTWQRGFGGTTADGGDANGDNMVDAADFQIWQDQFGTTGLPGTSIPEPAIATMLAAVLLAVGAATRRALPTTRRGHGPNA
jgi:hypothetical protein